MVWNVFSYGAIEAKKGNPLILPAVMTPGGPLDLSSVLFRNRIIFIGQPVNSMVAQRVISQLVTLATIDEEADILVCSQFYLALLLLQSWYIFTTANVLWHCLVPFQVYLNCPGGSTYSVLAIYDCMSWVNNIQFFFLLINFKINAKAFSSKFWNIQIVLNLCRATEYFWGGIIDG